MRYARITVFPPFDKHWYTLPVPMPREVEQGLEDLSEPHWQAVLAYVDETVREMRKAAGVGS